MHNPWQKCGVWDHFSGITLSDIYIISFNAPTALRGLNTLLWIKRQKIKYLASGYTAGKRQGQDYNRGP